MAIPVKKATQKIILDGFLLLLLALMYKKQAVNLAFHEIGGLALFGLFGVHILLNAKWVAAVTKRIFDRNLPVKLRLIYLNDILLVLAFALTAIGGVLISKIVFSFGGGMVWKTVHYTSAAVGLLLVGVHLGLHGQFLCAWLGKRIQIPAAKQIAAVCAVLLVVAGGYSAATSGISRWLTMPFTTLSQGTQGGPGAGTHTEGSSGMPSGKPAGAGTHGQQEISITNALSVACCYSSIVLGAGVLVYALEQLLTRARPRGVSGASRSQSPA